MTYAQKFGKFGIYTDNELFRWFKDLDKAEQAWSEMTSDPEAQAEWLEEFEDVQLVDMKSKAVIHSLKGQF